MHRDFRRFARSSASLILSSALFACGGGGSSSPATPAPTPVPAPVPAPPNAEAALLVTSANAEGVATLGFGFGGVALGMGQLAVDWTAQADSSATLSFINSCPTVGSATGTLVDRDGDKHASAGDTINVVLSNCFVKELDDTFDGTMVITLTAPLASQQRAGVVTFSGFSVRGGSPRQDVVGALRFDYTASRLSKLVHVYSDTQPFGINFSDGTKSIMELVTALDAQHESRLDTVRATTAMRLHLVSNLLGGSVDVTTATPWSAWFDTYPDAGEFIVAGSGASKASMRAASAKSGMFDVLVGATLVTSVSADGSGLLWTGAPWLPEVASAPKYTIVAASTTAFRPLLQPPAAGQIRPNGPLVWVYSRPLDPSSVTTAAFYYNGGGKVGASYASVPAKASVEGAMLSYTPMSQLSLGVSYDLINTSPTIRDLTGATLGTPRIYGTVPQSVSASIADGPKLLLGSGASLVLDAGASSANGQPVSATRWRQLSGPTLILTDANAPRVMLTVPAGTGNGIAAIEVETANAAGEFDRLQVDVTVAADLSSALVVAYRTGTAPLDVVSNIAPGSSGYASASVSQEGYPVLDVLMQGTRLLVGLQGGNTWQTGQRLAYGPGTTSGVYGPVWSGCGPVGTNSGSLAILDIVLDASGKLARLAIDIDDTCSTSGIVTQGSIRYHSALPLRQ